MKDPLRVPFEPAEPELAGPRLVHEAGGGDRSPVPSVCTELHEARLRGGYSVADAARVLRIQLHYLQALEDGRFDEIPGTTYTLGFLRSYAGFLGLDPNEIVDAFKREQGLNTGEQRLAFPSPTRDSPKPKFWLVLLVLVLAGLAYGGWQYQSTDGQIATDLVADVSTRLTEAVGLGAAESPQGDAAASATVAVAPEAEPRATETADPADSIPAEPAAAAPIAAEPAAAAPIAAEPIPAESTAAASGKAESAPAEPIVTAAAEPVPVPATSAPDQATPEAATEDTAVAVPAAEDWNETGAVPAAEDWTETSAVPAAEDGPVAPPPAKIEAAAATGAATPAVADPAEPLQPDEMAAPSEPVLLSAPAYPAEPVASGVETDSQRQAITAPLDLASATVGATASGEPDEGVAAVQDAAPEAMVDVPPDETIAVAAVNEAEPSSPSNAGYVPTIYGRSNVDARVVITALDDSWVQVQGPENELLLTRILHAGDSYRVPDRPGLVMVTGNAGGLEVRVDDAPAPALGPLGVVLRNIALDPDRLLAGTATAR